MIKSYLINLDKDSDRLDFFRQQFDRLELTFERIPAVDGRLMSDQDYADFQRARPRGHNKRWLRGQMGCFLSHFQAWERIAAGDDRYGAVFEDDIYVSDGLRHVLSDDAWIPTGVDVVRLEPSSNRVRLGRKLASLDGRDFYSVLSTSWCAGAYLLSREAARRLVALAPAQHQPADIMLFSFDDAMPARDMAIVQCQPAPCIQDKFLNPENHQFASNIERLQKKPGTGGAHGTRPPLTTLVMKALGALYRRLMNYRRVRYR